MQKTSRRRPPGISGLERVDASTAANSSNTKKRRRDLPVGQASRRRGSTGDGSGAPKVTVNESFPDSDGDRWNANAAEVVATGLAWNLQAFALCAKVS